jgi:hypothetical protein
MRHPFGSRVGAFYFLQDIKENERKMEMEWIDQKTKRNFSSYREIKIRQ